MKFINVGKIVNTHGIKGELRILSKFRYKDKVFKKGMKLYVGKKKTEYIINSYRFHKIFDMVTFDGYNNINDIEFLKGEFVYINEDDLILENNEFFSGKLIGFSVIIDDKIIGEVEQIIDTNANEVIKVGSVLIPYVKDFVLKIDEKNKKIYIKNVRGLM